MPYLSKATRQKFGLVKPLSSMDYEICLDCPWWFSIQHQRGCGRGDLLVNNESYNAKGTKKETSTAEKAAQSMTLIPDMIMASFESSFEKAMCSVRVRVDECIQGLESGSSNMGKEQVVKQMWSNILRFIKQYV